MLKKLLFIAMLLPTVIFADPCREKGIKLTEMFWKDAKENNVHHINKYIMQNYRGIGFNGAFGKTEQVAENENSTLSFYNLSNFVVTRTENTIIVTYTADLFETYQGTTLSGSAPRMTTWRKVHHQWKLMSHVSFARPQPT